MKCEICHKADATTAITLKKDGAEKELYVCDACAEKAKHPGKKKSASKKKADPDMPKIACFGADEAPSSLRDLVKATIGFMQEVVDAEILDKKECPVCKTKWNAIKESGRLGCPSCWKTYAKLIRKEFLASQFSNVHKGSSPDVVPMDSPSRSIPILMRQLDKAVASEDFRLAAKLKKQIDALKEEDDKSKGSQK